VCVCVQLRETHNCSHNKLLAIAFPFLYALRLLCAWLVPVSFSPSLSLSLPLPSMLFLVIEYIILLYLLTHTHTLTHTCEWHLNINCFVCLQNIHFNLFDSLHLFFFLTLILPFIRLQLLFLFVI